MSLTHSFTSPYLPSRPSFPSSQGSHHCSIRLENEDPEYCSGQKWDSGLHGTWEHTQSFKSLLFLRPQAQKMGWVKMKKKITRHIAGVQPPLTKAVSWNQFGLLSSVSAHELCFTSEKPFRKAAFFYWSDHPRGSDLRGLTSFEKVVGGTSCLAILGLRNWFFLEILWVTDPQKWKIPKAAPGARVYTSHLSRKYFISPPLYFSKPGNGRFETLKYVKCPNPELTWECMSLNLLKVRAGLLLGKMGGRSSFWLASVTGPRKRGHERHGSHF